MHGSSLKAPSQVNDTVSVRVCGVWRGLHGASGALSVGGGR